MMTKDKNISTEEVSRLSTLKATKKRADSVRSNLHLTQANMLAVFPQTTARDRGWWSHWCSLGSPDTSASFFARPLKKGAVDLPYPPVVLIATG